ncbi:MAG: hypothetical protein V4793_20450 [Paraburkholderia tropica]|uniref:Uncharacterized protein n=1 Tax=Paraburkholderia tropica TaxID=92647 RepID=A0ABX5MKS7_9BURK|nr:hypothetical protein [Paraburkholderia tropica]MDE1143336.1 hypothetical protein [Paraburkholderia tropica]PXX10658.1 hypothetical protein C7400_121135 [Paraburkholderia tropica]PZW75413.1 hypothetical protein C7399_121134 [Paraburkholderia tropica]
MDNFVYCLVSNLALLAAVQLVCWFIRAMRPDLSVRGARVFVGMMVLACAFDAALTFLVFADAGGPWRERHPVEAFFPRAAAYVLSALFALVAGGLASRRAANRNAERSNERSNKRSNERNAARDGLVIETSPYSKSTLPM